MDEARTCSGETVILSGRMRRWRIRRRNMNWGSKPVRAYSSHSSTHSHTASSPQRNRRPNRFKLPVDSSVQEPCPAELQLDGNSVTLTREAMLK